MAPHNRPNEKTEPKTEPKAEPTAATEPTVSVSGPAATTDAAAAMLRELSGDAPEGEEPAAEPTTPTALDRMKANDGNRFHGLFESWHFAVSDSDKEYPDNAGINYSKKIANVVLVLDGGFAAVPGTIYARRNVRTKRTVAEFSFVGSRAAQAIKAMDERAKRELDVLKGRIVDDYLAWRTQTGNVSTGKRSSGTAREISGVDFEIDTPVDAPAPAAPAK